MLIDFRKDRTVTLAIKINDCVLERVSSCKLLGLWINDDLKWKTNTEYIVKNAAKQLHFLKILIQYKGYNAPREDLKTFYIPAIGSILENGTKIWHGSLTEEQSKDIERIQRRGMKMTYEQALIECGMETLENRREKMCINLINDMKGLIYINSMSCYHLQLVMYGRETRDLIQINFVILNVELNVLAIVFSVCIRKYNIAIDNL